MEWGDRWMGRVTMSAHMSGFRFVGRVAWAAAGINVVRAAGEGEGGAGVCKGYAERRRWLMGYVMQSRLVFCETDRGMT